MKSFLRVSDLDARVWSTATWAAPFAIQVVLGVAIAISWLMGKYVPGVDGFAQYASAAAGTLVLSAAVSVWLFRSVSPRAQGVALSIVGSFVVAVIGASAYGYWIIGW